LKDEIFYKPINSNVFQFGIHWVRFDLEKEDEGSRRKLMGERKVMMGSRFLGRWVKLEKENWDGKGRER